MNVSMDVLSKTFEPARVVEFQGGAVEAVDEHVIDEQFSAGADRNRLHGLGGGSRHFDQSSEHFSSFPACW